MTYIDGLVSGLDTTSLISRLMQLERRPVERIVAQRVRAESTAQALSALRSQVQGVATAADRLSQPSNWATVRAASTDPAVATASAEGAAPGSFTFRVDQVATAHAVVTTSEPMAKGSAWSSGEITIDVAGQHVVVEVGADPDTGLHDLHQVVIAINGAGLGVRASAVHVGEGLYRLQLSSEETGAASVFEVVSGLAATTGVLTQGGDARLTVGDGLYEVTSPGNVFDDLLPGVTVTARAVSADPVTVTVEPDHESIATRVQSLVQSVNRVLGDVRTLTSYDPKTRQPSLLTGSFVVRRMAQELTGALMGAVAGAGVVPGQVGIRLANDGSVTFDKAAFLAALAEDPAGVEHLFAGDGGSAQGITGRLAATTAAATDHVSGYLRTAEESQRSRVEMLGRDIENLEVRLGRREATLRQQFAALESSLGRLRDQSTWLAGQLEALAPNRR